MKAADVWTLILGAVVALAGTLLAQWSSLAYQTRRQREARRADFQRATLIQIRDALLELTQAMRTAFSVRYEAEERDQDFGGLPTYHPAVEAVRSLMDRIVILATAVEDEELRGKLDTTTRMAYLAAIAPTARQADESRQKMGQLQREAVQLLGDQLRQLP
jgi:hypothetical protein